MREDKLPLSEHGALYLKFKTENGVNATNGSCVKFKDTTYILINEEWMNYKKYYDKYIEPITKNNMEKQIKMSLDTARKIYSDYNNRADSCSFLFIQWLLENFTKEELEGKKGFTWEESFNKEGYYIGRDARIYLEDGLQKVNDNRCLFKTREQAESALAFSQLTHIVARYNQDKKVGETAYTIKGNITKNMLWVRTLNYGCDSVNLVFLNEQDAIISLQQNKELWLKYWLINEH